MCVWAILLLISQLCDLHAPSDFHRRFFIPAPFSNVCECVFFLSFFRCRWLVYLPWLSLVLCPLRHCLECWRDHAGHDDGDCAIKQLNEHCTTAHAHCTKYFFNVSRKKRRKKKSKNFDYYMHCLVDSFGRLINDNDGVLKLNIKLSCVRIEDEYAESDEMHF